MFDLHRFSFSFGIGNFLSILHAVHAKPVKKPRKMIVKKFISNKMLNLQATKIELPSKNYIKI